MTLPVSGAISFNAINVELGVAGTTTANINQATYRTLAGVPGSGTTISLSNFYGKSNRVSVSSTFSSSTANASLNISAIGGYVAGVTDITVTINGGVYLYATSTGNYGLNLTGGTAGDTLTIVNNGFIMGMGGLGGTNPILNGNAGGPALNIPISATINNTNGSAYIGGGGGGGGGGGSAGGGGGVGGGTGGFVTPNSGLGGGTGGAGGGIGASGANAQTGSSGGTSFSGGGGGGRVFPGTGGAGVTVTSPARAPGLGGTDDGGGGTAPAIKGSVTSGAGGSANAVGGNGNGSSAGGGGGWGATGGNGNNGIGTASFGGAGGKAVNLNGNSVTWTSGNTTRVYGAVS